jgi:hypothetical protein
MAIAWKAAVNSGISGAASQIPIGPTRTRSHDKAATAPDVYSSGRCPPYFQRPGPRAPDSNDVLRPRR